MLTISICINLLDYSNKIEKIFKQKKIFFYLINLIINQIMRMEKINSEMKCTQIFH